jgi:hypothetical protein
MFPDPETMNQHRVLRHDKRSTSKRHIDSYKHLVRRPLAIVLLRAAALSRAMDEYVDELFLKKEIGLKTDVQLRRTLTQSNRWAIDLVDEEDQIICRNIREHGGHGKILVVDQLGMWILDDSELLKFSPRSTE